MQFVAGEEMDPYITNYAIGFVGPVRSLSAINSIDNNQNIPSYQ